ncbi:hypothetical protein NSE01_14790 [Novosphingobium sediminis]|uniref:Uncharacterized protein n=1 Tax=Novosphingobium sediminis TaxID=707214 RepID=A0A512AIY0_9SPHN|nr:hypothetical protein [Novosphingobium sediminis]GEN99646.1 hypothetical protein NSE01_14790 [Novosphingobium sediminis]
MSEPRATSVAGRVRKGALVVSMLVMAVAALLSGTDRQSREFPNSPSFVGWPYDTGAARARAMLTFVRQGPAHAIAYARRAVASDPISAQAVSILGQAQLYSQHTAEAHKAFSVSGQLGWRDGMTQIYWLDQALQDQDYKVAAERLDALLRQAPSDENRDRLLAAVAASEAGRSALAERLKLAPVWARTMVTTVSELPADQVLQRIDLMRRTGKGVWDCPTSEFITQRLINLGMIQEAQSVWQLNCETSGALLYDGGFDHIDTLQKSTAFDWQLSNRGDAEITIAGDGGQRSLALEVTGTVSLPIVQQIVVLKPGRYQLSWRTPDTNSAQARALQVSLACNADFSKAQVGEPVAGKSDTWRQQFVIDNQCQVRQLIFWLAPGAPIHLDDVALSLSR